MCILRKGVLKKYRLKRYKLNRLKHVKCAIFSLIDFEKGGTSVKRYNMMENNI